MSDLVDTLQRTKEWLLENPWGKGPDRGDRGESCVADAFFATMLHSGSMGRSLLTFCEANGIEGPVDQWNDSPRRTFAEVMDAFDAAIIWAKEQEAVYGR